MESLEDVNATDNPGHSMQKSFFRVFSSTFKNYEEFSKKGTFFDKNKFLSTIPKSHFRFFIEKITNTLIFRYFIGCKQYKELTNTIAFNEILSDSQVDIAPIDVVFTYPLDGSSFAYSLRECFCLQSKINFSTIYQEVTPNGTKEDPEYFMSKSFQSFFKQLYGVLNRESILKLGYFDEISDDLEVLLNQPEMKTFIISVKGQSGSLMLYFAFLMEEFQPNRKKTIFDLFNQAAIDLQKFFPISKCFKFLRKYDSYSIKAHQNKITNAEELRYILEDVLKVQVRDSRESDRGSSETKMLHVEGNFHEENLLFELVRNKKINNLWLDFNFQAEVRA